MDSAFYKIENKQSLVLFNRSNKRNFESTPILPPVYAKLEGGVLLTPNNDGVFDNLVVISTAPVPADYRLKIRDVNNVIIFETTSFSTPWNGKLSNNTLAPIGNYFYDITFNNQSIKAQFLVQY
jgi:gliding motility-associated-like protein